MAGEKNSPARKTGVAAWNEDAGIASRNSAGSRQSRSQSDRRGRIVALALLALALVACVVCFIPIKEQITRGLWLREGTATTVRVTDAEGKAATDDVVSSAASIVRSRLGKVGISEYAVDAADGASIVIKLPTTIDGEALAKSVSGAGLVEFVRMDEIGDADALVKLNAGTEDVTLAPGTYTAFMDGSSVSSAEVTEVSSANYALTMYFDEQGKQTFADVTEELAENYGSIAIVLDGTVITAPYVSEQIADGQVSITGNFTSEEANALKAVLESDVIDATMTYDSTERIGPLAGKAGLWGMVVCAVAAFVALAGVTFARHKRLAVLTAGTELVFAIFMFGLMAIASRNDMFVLTVPGVVGGVVATVVGACAAWRVVDAFAHEACSGKSLRGAATTSPSAALGPFVLPCVLAFGVALALLLVPVALVRDFALTFVFGTLSATLAIAWFELPLLRLLATGPMQNDPSSWGVQSTQKSEPPVSEGQ